MEFVASVMTYPEDATNFASSAELRAVGRGSFDSVLRSSNISRFRHVAAVLVLVPNSRLNSVIEACDRSFAGLTAFVSSRTCFVCVVIHVHGDLSSAGCFLQKCPAGRGIMLTSFLSKGTYRQTIGSNTRGRDSWRTTQNAIPADGMCLYRSGPQALTWRNRPPGHFDA